MSQLSVQLPADTKRLFEFCFLLNCLNVKACLSPRVHAYALLPAFPQGSLQSSLFEKFLLRRRVRSFGFFIGEFLFKRGWSCSGAPRGIKTKDSSSCVDWCGESPRRSNGERSRRSSSHYSPEGGWKSGAENGFQTKVRGQHRCFSLWRQDSKRPRPLQVQLVTASCN